MNSSEAPCKAMGDTSVCHFRHACVAALVLLAITRPCYAYIDPGTGSIILQGLLASIAVALGVLKLYWQRCRIFLLTLVRSGVREDETKPAESSDPQ